MNSVNPWMRPSRMSMEKPTQGWLMAMTRHGQSGGIDGSVDVRCTVRAIDRADFVNPHARSAGFIRADFGFLQVRNPAVG